MTTVSGCNIELYANVLSLLNCGITPQTLSSHIILTLFIKGYRTRIDVYETLCPQQMLVHKGGKIKNWGVQRCHTYKLQSQNIFKESTGGEGGGGLEGSGWM